MITIEDDGSAAIAFGPYIVFVVTQCDDATFSTIGIPIFVRFNDLYTHRWNDVCVGVQSSIRFLCDDVIGVLFLETVILLAV